jgi:hypothetical protein
LDSPLARQDPRLDITDLYVFPGETGTVLVIDVCHSKAGDLPSPGYHPEGKYEFKIDLNGDAIEELTYRFTFADRNVNGEQPIELRRLSGNGASDSHAQGTVIATGFSDDILDAGDGIRAWAGKAGDPFWIEPDVLHAVGHALQDGTVVDLSGWDATKARNFFAGDSVYAIVLEIPDGALTTVANGGRIGVWALASLQTDAGGWRSINRVGLPMVHPLFTQYNEDLGDRLNGGSPSTDSRSDHTAPAGVRPADVGFWTALAELASTARRGRPASKYSARPSRGQDRWRSGLIRDRGRSARLCRDRRPSHAAKHLALSGRHPGGVRVRRLERAVTH